MAKFDLFEEARAAGLVAGDADVDDYTVAELEKLLGSGAPAEVSGPSSDDPDAEPLTQPHPDEPIVAADGHVVLSQADIDARQ